MDNRLYLSPDQLLERWGNLVTKQTLGLWRRDGKGPMHMKIGNKVVYPIDFVIEYEQKAIKNGAKSRP
jgi:hypothetical protein